MVSSDSIPQVISRNEWEYLITNKTQALYQDSATVKTEGRSEDFICNWFIINGVKDSGAKCEFAYITLDGKWVNWAGKDYFFNDGALVLRRLKDNQEAGSADNKGFSANDTLLKHWNTGSLYLLNLDGSLLKPDSDPFWLIPLYQLSSQRILQLKNTDTLNWKLALRGDNEANMMRLNIWFSGPHDTCFGIYNKEGQEILKPAAVKAYRFITGNATRKYRHLYPSCNFATVLELNRADGIFWLNEWGQLLEQFPPQKH